MNAFIAWRYLITHLRQTLVCIAGVVISVMMFITMLSMMHGFTDKFINETVEASGDVQAQAAHGGGTGERRRGQARRG